MDHLIPLRNLLFESCLICERKIPGFTKIMLDNIASISGKDKFIPHFEQMLQRLTELLYLYKPSYMNGVIQ